MANLGELIKSLRGKESLRDASERIGISHTYLDTVEKGRDKRSGNPVNPTPETLRLIAKAYNYSYEELMEVAGYIEGKSEEEKRDWDSKLPELNSKDERDLADDLEYILNNLGPGGAYSQFDGQTMDDADQEDREILAASIKNTMRLAKRMAKQKFTPKKYRD